MQNFLSQAMEAAEDTGVHPGQAYSNIEHAQYDNSQYGFAQDSNSFPIDQNLDMSVNFATSDGKNQDEGLGAGHISLRAQNGHGGVLGSHPGSTHTSTSLATAAQPQTPHSQSAKRKSPEDASENTPAGGDSRRKRSKVSRACDQCRKKKIRCDADSGDGTLKTCTNCIKQGQTCDYNRIPQKRGPSKGYIKDLSERVHHLEDSLANSSNYRASLDAGNYPDAPFSPDEDLALRRQSSIGQQRSPFADFTRDRFPSVGGWSNNPLSATQLRERGSIAIPPDQIGPSLPPSARTTKSSWALPNMPLEKIKSSAEIEENTKILDTMDLNPYFETIHPQCPILPEKDKIRAVLEKASNEYVLAFNTAVRLLPRKAQDNDTSDQTRKDLESFILRKAELKWEGKTIIDNMVLLWSTLLLQVIILHDMQGYGAQNILTTVALELGGGFVKMRDFQQDIQHENDWIRSLSIAALFARLDALSQGNSTDPLPSYLTTYLNVDWQSVVPRTRFLVMMTDMLQAALAMLPRDGGLATMECSIGYARIQSSNIRAWLSASDISRDEPFVKEIEAFATLLSLRLNIPSARPAVVGPVCNLVEAIRVNSLEQSGDRYRFSPLSFHTVVLATIVLLELQSCNFDHDQGQPLVESAMSDMMKQLNGLVAQRSELSGGVNGLFWPKALIDLVDDKMKQIKKSFSTLVEKGEDDVVPEMARIFQRGYILPLLSTIPS